MVTTSETPRVLRLLCGSGVFLNKLSEEILINDDIINFVCETLNGDDLMIPYARCTEETIKVKREYV